MTDKQHNIVDIRKAFENFRFPSIAIVENYWRELAISGRIPRRSDVDPKKLGPALSNTFILDKIAPGVGKFRIAGMKLHRMLDMDLRSMPASSIIAPPSRSGFRHSLEQVFNGEATAHIHGVTASVAGVPGSDMSLFLAPLACEDGRLERIIGCIEGDFHDAPNRLHITSNRLQPIVQGARRYVHASDNPMAYAGMAEDGDEYLTNSQAEPSQEDGSHLKLVYSRE